MEDRKFFTLDSEQFFLDSAPEDVTKLIKSIEIIQKEIANIEISLDIAQIARNHLVDKIKEFTPQMERVIKDKTLFD